MDMLPPVRLTLAHTPTPLEPLSRSTLFESLELWVKRDDLTGVGLSGNKVRKLEFLAADAIERGADTLITCGAVTSNHARATAIAAARLGLQSVLLLRGKAKRPADGNLLLDNLVGADVRFIHAGQWAQRAEIMEEIAAELVAAGRRGYVIPEGGSSPVGTMGYAVAIEEMLTQEAQLGIKISSVISACGTGGTTAGLALGLAAAGRRDIAVYGVAVCDDRAYFDAVIQRLIADCTQAGFVTSEVAARAAWQILEGYKGSGYAQASPDGLDLIRRIARDEGLLLDPVYTGKCMTGLLSEAQAGRLGGEGATVFFHTGGIFGLFNFARDLDAGA